MPVAATYERRTLNTEFEVRSAPDGHKVIEGYAAKFNRYSENLGGFVEAIRPGAFARSLSSPDIFGRYEHVLVLGRTGAGTLRVHEDETGLYYEIDVNMADTEAVSAAAKIERGDVNKSSFAFNVTRDGDAWGETDDGFPLREIVSVSRLYDVSPVSIPAYRDTDSGIRELALRSFASAHDLPSPLVEAAAENGELLELIRGARNLAPEPEAPPIPAISDQRSAVAPVVAVRIEQERLAMRRRAAARAAYSRPR